MTERVGRYRVLTPLGRGAMGVVYLAEDPLLNRQVAIKTVDISVEDESEREFLRDRLLRDARAAAALSHPNIVSVYDVIEEGNTAYLVMEYISGDSLAARLKKTAPLDSAFTLRVLREMAAALDYTHARGIIHRDIKPGNVMIEASGTAKIMDFGIARMAGAHTSTPTGMVMGTIQYMAPEQIKGEALDGRADQFALAAAAYEMMTGVTLFGQHTLATLAYKIVNEAAPPVRTRNAALPPGVDAVMNKALSKLPNERFSTCGQFVGALDAAFGTQPLAADAPTFTMRIEPPTVASGAAGNRSRAIAPIAAVAGALVILGGGLMVWKPWAGSARLAGPIAKAIPVAPAASPVPGETADETASEIPPKKSEAGPAKPAPVAPPKDLVSAPAKKAIATGPPDEADESIPIQASTPHPAMEAFQRGQELIKARQFAAAVEPLTKAISLKRNFAAAYLARGTAYQQQEHFEAAVADYSEVIRIMPGHAFTYNLRGSCFTRLHQDDPALVDYNQALQLKPELVQPHLGRGQIYYRKKAYHKAIADLTEAIRLNPALAAAYHFRSMARQATGDAPGAKSDMQRFKELKPDSPPGEVGRN